MEVKPNALNFFVSTLSRNGYKGTEIHNLLTNAWGEEDMVSLRRVQQISKEFENGRESMKRAVGSGRPRTSLTPDNIETVRELIEDDCMISCSHVSNLTGIPERSVHRLLTKELNKKSLCSRWVPHLLNEHNKQERIERSIDLLAAYSRRGAKDKIIVIDEKWIYLRDVPPPQCNRAWVDEAGDRPHMARRTISDKKVLIILASNFSKSLVYKEVLHDGGSINAERYLQFLENMTNEFEGTLPRWEMIIQHDNARPHVARVVQDWLAGQHVTLLKQPAYSPDTNLMDRYLFRNYETFRRGVNFNQTQDVDGNVEEYLNSVTNRQMSKELECLKAHLQKIIDADGDYL